MSILDLELSERLSIDDKIVHEREISGHDSERSMYISCSKAMCALAKGRPGYQLRGHP